MAAKAFVVGGEAIDGAEGVDVRGEDNFVLHLGGDAEAGGENGDVGNAGEPLAVLEIVLAGTNLLVRIGEVKFSAIRGSPFGDPLPDGVVRTTFGYLRRRGWGGSEVSCRNTEGHSSRHGPCHHHKRVLSFGPFDSEF